MRHVALQIHAPFCEFSDLLQEGLIGLWLAHRDYQMHRDVKFETYARVRIRGAMLDYLRRIDPLGRTDRARVRAGGQKPELDLPTYTEPTECELPGTLTRLRDALAHLPARERHIIRRQYFHEATGREIATELGICGARVTQLREQALDRLRRRLQCATVGL